MPAPRQRHAAFRPGKCGGGIDLFIQDLCTDISGNARSSFVHDWCLSPGSAALPGNRSPPNITTSPRQAAGNVFSSRCGKTRRNRPKAKFKRNCVARDHAINLGVDAGAVAGPAAKDWWSLTESNRRHPACKAGALPAELRPHGGEVISEWRGVSCE